MISFFSSYILAGLILVFILHRVNKGRPFELKDTLTIIMFVLFWPAILINDIIDYWDNF